MTETVRQVLEVDADGAIQEIDSAAAAARRLQEAFDRARKHAQDFTRDGERGFASMQRGGEKVAAMLGGPFGDLADIIFDIGDAAHGSSAAIGTMGATAAVAAVAVAALSYAGVQLASSAAEAADRLEAAGLASLIPSDARASLDEYSAAMEGASRSADLLLTQIGAPAAAAVANLANAFSGAVQPVTDVHRALEPLIETASSGWTATTRLREALIVLGSGGYGAAIVGVSEGLGLVRDRGREAAQAMSDLATKTKRWSDDVDQALSEVLAEEEHRRKSAEEGERRIAEARRKAIEDAKRLAAETERLSAAESARARAAVLADTPLEARVTADRSAVLGQATVTRIPMATVTQVGDAPADMSASIAAALANVDSINVGSIVAQGAAELATGGAGGVLGAAASAGPVGAGAVALLSLPDAIGAVDDTITGLVDMFESFPEQLADALTNALPSILDAIPELAGAILEAVLSIPGILIQTLPQIIFQALIELPVAIAREIGEALLGPLGGLKEKTSFLRDKQGDALIDLKAEGGRSLFWSSFDSGSRGISRSGLAMVHRGEEIRRPHAAGRSGNSGGNTYHITNSDPREVLRMLRQLQGGEYGPTYGLGDSL